MGTGKTVWGLLVFQTAPYGPSGGPGEHPGLCPSFCFSGGSPSDNVGQAALGAMSPEQVERLKGYWGVDLPPAERYLSWAADVLRGDMGTSLLYRRPVAEVIWEKLSNSLCSWPLPGAVGPAGLYPGRPGGKKTGRDL